MRWDARHVRCSAGLAWLRALAVQTLLPPAGLWVVAVRRRRRGMGARSRAAARRLLRLPARTLALFGFRPRRTSPTNVQTPYSCRSPQDLLNLPQLPPNAEYIKTSACTSTWGAVAAVMGRLPVSSFEYFVVVDSSVKGPFLPVYVQEVGAARAREEGRG